MAGFDLSDVLAAARGIPGAREDGRWRCVVYLSAYDWMSGWLRASDMAAQSAACKAWLSAHGDARKVETIRNRNAVRNVRAAFDELMRVIENRRADCVVVPDIAVFALCFSEARFYVEEVLVPMGFRFVDCARGFDTQGGDVRAYFKGLQTEMSDALALHAEHDRLASGGLIRRNVPFGYVFDENAPCGVRVDGEVAAFVPRIFELAAQGRWWRSKLEGQVCVSSSRFEQMGNFSLTVSGRSRWRSPAGGRPPAAHATPTAGRGTCRCGSAAPVFGNV